jgi:hypothetical protein
MRGVFSRGTPWVLRLVVGICLLGLLLWRFPISVEAVVSTLGAIRLPILFVAMILLFNQFVISSLKWRAILRSHGIRLPLARLVRSYMIGSFFSAFLPSSVGGDVVRVVDVARTTGRGFESASAVVFERLSGLAALACVGTVASFYVARAFGEPAFLRLGVLFGMLCAFLVIAFVPGIVEATDRLFGRLPFGTIQRAYERVRGSVVHYRRRPGLLVHILALSFLFQLMAYTIFFLYGRALDLPVPYVYYLAFVPVVYLLETLPVSVAGIGLREGGLLYFLGKMGLTATEAISMSIVVLTCRYTVSLSGGLLFALGRHARPPGNLAPDSKEEWCRSGGWRLRALQKDRARTLLRNLTPGFVGTVYYFAKCRCFVHPKAMVQLSRRISFGRKTTVHRYARIIVGKGRVVLGSHSNVQCFTTIAAGDGVVSLGDHVRIGPNCSLLGADHEYRDRETPIHMQPMTNPGLKIGDDVWIGANCVVLPGIEIGRGCVVGAGSVVTRSLPPYSVAVGNPARVIKNR